MSQHAIGGAGGAADGGGRGGAGGAAISELASGLVLPDLSDVIEGTAKATGGTGGGADVPGGGDGGTASAKIELTSEVASMVTATAEAIGGDGSNGGAGGNALAEADAVATNGEARAQATAQGGSGSSPGLAEARAHAVSHGDSASPDPISAEASAIADGDAYNLAESTSDVARGDGSPGSELISAAIAHASSEGDGARGAYTFADYDSAHTSAYDPDDAHAVGGIIAAPDAAQIASFMADVPNIASGFQNATSYFAIAEVAGRHSGGSAGLQTASVSIDFSLDLDALDVQGDLLIGFNGFGTGFTSLAFTITADGNLLENESWTDLGDALAFFNDRYRDDYGPVAALDSDSDDNLIDFQITFEIVTETANEGFWGDIIIGDPPPQPSPADAWEMATAMAEHMGTPVESHDTPAPASDTLPTLDALHHDMQHDHFVV
jgi:hypothetical protein